MKTQCDRIESRLKRANGKYVSMPALARAASPSSNGAGLAVHSRISDLRHLRGLNVAMKSWTVKGQRHTAYALV